MRSLDLGGENQRGKRWEEEINPKARGRRERETRRRSLLERLGPRTRYHLFYKKKMCECVGRENVEFLKNELDGMDGTSV